MKFSDISKEDWPSLKPYMDTVLLPVTGLSGREEPWKATQALEQLRDVMDLVEIPYTGRIVTYPALHYNKAAGGPVQIDDVCSRLKDDAGFNKVIVIVTDPEFAESALNNADLVICESPEEVSSAPSEVKSRLAHRIQLLWSST